MRDETSISNLKGSDHLEDQGVDGSIISELILRKQDGKGVNWISWWVLVNTVMNFWPP
jgi:hypothetical protein